MKKIITLSIFFMLCAYSFVLADNTSERYVYIGDNSPLFHLYGCEELKTTPNKISLSSAQNRGYYPCKVCNPYHLVKVDETQQDSINITPIVIGIILILSLVLIFILKKKGLLSLQSILTCILIIGYIAIPLAGTMLHIYTTYLLSISNGFWGAFLGFCFPIISEIFVLFDNIAKYGILNNYFALCLGYILVFALTILVSYILENIQED